MNVWDRRFQGVRDPLLDGFNASIGEDRFLAAAEIRASAAYARALGEAGVLGAAWLAVRTGVADLPAGVGWRHLAGAGTLAGIGFTMSLFVANLAFETALEAAQAKSAIFAASIVAGLLGYAVLRFWAPASASR